jgi:hypothetical protein
VRVTRVDQVLALKNTLKKLPRLLSTWPDMVNARRVSLSASIAYSRVTPVVDVPLNEVNSDTSHRRCLYSEVRVYLALCCTLL